MGSGCYRRNIGRNQQPASTIYYLFRIYLSRTRRRPDDDGEGDQEVVVIGGISDAISKLNQQPAPSIYYLFRLYLSRFENPIYLKFSFSQIPGCLCHCNRQSPEYQKVPCNKKSKKNSLKILYFPTRIQQYIYSLISCWCHNIKYKKNVKT